MEQNEEEVAAGGVESLSINTSSSRCPKVNN